MDSATSGLATGRMLELSEQLLVGPPLVVGLIIPFRSCFLSWVLPNVFTLYSFCSVLFFFFGNNARHGHAWNALRKGPHGHDGIMVPRLLDHDVWQLAAPYGTHSRGLI